MNISKNMKSIFWGIFFIFAAVLIVVNQLGYLGEVNVFSLGFTLLLVPIMVKSISYLNFFGVFFPLAIIGILFEKQLGFQKIVPWPILLIALFLAIGFEIIFHNNKHKHRYWEHKGPDKYEKVIDMPDSNVVDLKVHLGSSIKYVNTQELQRANLSCSFGAMKVYFDRANVHEEGAEIRMDVTCGGVELYIPRTWKLIHNVNVSLGGIEEKNYRGEEGSIPVVLTGNVSLSGIEIIYV